MSTLSPSVNCKVRGSFIMLEQLCKLEFITHECVYNIYCLFIYMYMYYIHFHFIVFPRQYSQYEKHSIQIIKLPIIKSNYN